MHALPPWEKGDAMDMVLLVTACLTLFNRLPEIGLVLLLVDTATDTLDLLVRMALASISQGHAVAVDELTAKKLSLLGVMALVATHRWRGERERLARRAVTASAAARGRAATPLEVAEAGGGRTAVSEAVEAVTEVALPALTLLIGRLLMASIFFYAALSELLRLLLPTALKDIDPDDPHNIVWPKLVELALAIPFVLGARTAMTARALAVTLAIEAGSVWQFWAADALPQRLHMREHFSVNVAVAGGLLLVQEVGGGKFAMDHILKKAE